MVRCVDLGNRTPLTRQKQGSDRRICGWPCSLAAVRRTNLGERLQRWRQLHNPGQTVQASLSVACGVRRTWNLILPQALTACGPQASHIKSLSLSLFLFKRRTMPPSESLQEEPWSPPGVTAERTAQGPSLFPLRTWQLLPLSVGVERRARAGLRDDEEVGSAGFGHQLDMGFWS